jgi:flavin reductase (DIM6/NTAB) family NADH-FMN oxidoreductase RutF
MSAVSLDPAELQPAEGYRLLTSLVVPRPIAWVGTRGRDGSINLAPFSFFNAVGDHPPTIMISVGSRRGQLKDTRRNIEETGVFVVNLVSRDLAEAMNLTSGDWPYGDNEFERAGLGTVPGDVVAAPRVAQAQAALECRLSQVVPVSGTHYTMILGQVVRFHLAEGLMRPNGTADPVGLGAIGRLSGEEFATLGSVFSMPRPIVNAVQR